MPKYFEKEIKIFNKNFKIFLNEQVFEPNLTTTLLIESSYKVVKKNDKILDLGCGSGRWAQFVSPKVKKLTALDASEKTLSVAKKLLKNQSNINFLKGDVVNLSIKDQSYDFAYSLGVLHHVKDIERALKERIRLQTGNDNSGGLKEVGLFRYRKSGEAHGYSPTVFKKIQYLGTNGKKPYTKINDDRPVYIRDLLCYKTKKRF